VKVPALNVVHVCGTVATNPHQFTQGDRLTGARFDLIARSYERGKKPIPVRFSVVCWATLAEATLSRVREGDVVLVTGALHNYQSRHGSLQVVAAAVQFLTVKEATASDRE
jgi:single-stranded DNA-binding protein